MSTPLVVNLEVSSSQLAGIFRMNNWPLSQCKESTPTAADLEELLAHIALQSYQAAKSSYVSFGRLIAFTDAEVPGVVEVALKIGYARPALGDDADKPMIGDNFGEAL